MEIKDLAKIDVAAILKNKNLLANLGIIFVALIITRNLHVAQMQKANSLKEQIASEDKIVRFVNDLRKLENNISSLEKEFSSDVTANVVIDMISSLARKNAVRISALDSQSTRDKKLYQLLPARVNIETGYHRLGHFVSDLENSRELKVESLSIAGKETFYTEKPIEYSVSLNLITFSLKKK